MISRFLSISAVAGTRIGNIRLLIIMIVLIYTCNCHLMNTNQKLIKLKEMDHQEADESRSAIVGDKKLQHDLSVVEPVDYAGNGPQWDRKLSVRFKRDSSTQQPAQTVLPRLSTVSNTSITTETPTAPSQNETTDNSTAPSNITAVVSLPTTSSNSTEENQRTNISSTEPAVSNSSQSSTTMTPAESTTANATANTTVVANDDRKYYTVEYKSTAAEGGSYWRHVDRWLTHSALNGHMVALKPGQATQVVTPWNFTFYGHEVNKITVAVGGFLYMSPFLHRYLTATQYIAPLMANFDSTIGDNNTIVQLVDLDDALVIEWKNVYLHDQHEAGAFSFQAQLYKADGKIIFVYKDVPIPVGNISSDGHAVKVGIADAYYHDIGSYRTIYEYHNVPIDFSLISSNFAVIFNHQTTCNLLKDCESCQTANLPQFDCYWCNSLQRCSDALDRGLQQWVVTGCPMKPEDRETCPVPTTTTTQRTTTGTKPTISSDPCSGENKNHSVLKQCVHKTGSHASKHADKASTVVSSAGAVAGIIIGVILAALLISGVVFYLYGYRNPSSIPGQFIIKYRPSELGRRISGKGNSGVDYRVSSQTLTNEAFENNIHL